MGTFPVNVAMVGPETMIVQLRMEALLLKERIEVLEAGLMVVRHAVPSKLVEGMLCVADGTDWNPGSGAGAYLYLGAAWNKL